MTSFTPETGQLVDVEDAPKMLGRMIRTTEAAYMLPREFIKNAIDNPVDGVPLRIDWLELPHGGVPKLALIDNACGMTKDEMITFGRTAGLSFGTKDASGNFGIGARLIGLRSHPHGVSYYSRHVGDPAIHALRFYLDDEGKLRSTPVIKVREAPADLGEHGTLVVFHGRDDKHNTVTEPYDGASSGGMIALIKTIIRRMYRFTDGTEVRVDKGLHAGGGFPRPIRTMEEHILDLSDKGNAKYKTVKLADGTRLHYALFAEKEGDDQRQSLSGATFKGVGGVIWNDELYYQCDGVTWQSEAQHLGIDRIAHRCWVFVELPKAYPHAEPLPDRTALSWKTNPKRPGYEARRLTVFIRNFRAEIEDNMPVFIRRAIKDHEAKGQKKEEEDNRREFRLLMAELGAGHIAPVVTPTVVVVPPTPTPTPTPTPNPTPTTPPNPNPNDTPKPNAKERMTLPSDIDVRFVRDCIEDVGGGDAPIKIIPALGARLPELLLSEAFPHMKATKAECRAKLAMYDDEAFEAWWARRGALAARLTYGRHYAACFVYAKSGRVDEAKAMFSQPNTLGAISWHPEFVARMLRYVEAEVKLRVVTSPAAAFL